MICRTCANTTVDTSPPPVREPAAAYSRPARELGALRAGDSRRSFLQPTLRVQSAELGEIRAGGGSFFFLTTNIALARWHAGLADPSQRQLPLADHAGGRRRVSNSQLCTGASASRPRCPLADHAGVARVAGAFLTVDFARAPRQAGTAAHWPTARALPAPRPIDRPCGRCEGLRRVSNSQLCTGASASRTHLARAKQCRSQMLWRSRARAAASLAP